jgi:hypothetical protein
MRHLAQAVRNGLDDRAGTCIDPRTQIVEGKTLPGELPAQSRAGLPALEGPGEIGPRRLLRAQRPRHGADRRDVHRAVHRYRVGVEVIEIHTR